jgi:hypothetical protein
VKYSVDSDVECNEAVSVLIAKHSANLGGHKVRWSDLTCYANCYDSAIVFIFGSEASTLSIEMLLTQCTWSVGICRRVIVRHYTDRFLMNVHHTIGHSCKYPVIMGRPVS